MRFSQTGSRELSFRLELIYRRGPFADQHRPCCRTEVMRVQWHAFISPLRVECEEACADARCQRIFTPLLKQLAGALGIVGGSGGGIKRSEILIRAEVGRIDTNDCFKRSCGAAYPPPSDDG